MNVILQLLILRSKLAYLKGDANANHPGKSSQFLNQKNPINSTLSIVTGKNGPCFSLCSARHGASAYVVTLKSRVRGGDVLGS